MSDYFLFLIFKISKLFQKVFSLVEPLKKLGLGGLDDGRFKKSKDLITMKYFSFYVFLALLGGLDRTHCATFGAS